MAEKVALNINIPKDISDELKEHMSKSGYSKSYVVNAALHMFLSIKREEQDFQDLNRDRKIRSRVILEALPKEEGEQQRASVLLY